MDDPALLLNRYFDGTLSDEQHARLNDWINADPSHARQFAEFALLHDQLHNEYASRRALAVENESSADQTTPETHRPAAGQVESKEKLSRSRRPDAVLALICSVIAVLLTVWAATDTDPDKPANDSLAAAVLATVSGEAYMVMASGKRQPADSGLTISNGTTIETVGSTSLVEVTFSDGTQILIAGESSVVCSSLEPKTLVISRGAVSASVEPQPSGQPMLLHTPLASVEVLGTEFNLASAAGITDLHVTEGRVKLTRELGGESLVVNQGTRAVARAETSDVVVRDVRQTSDTWEQDYEDGLPASCVLGEFIGSGLPAGSRGAVSDLPSTTDSDAHGIDHNDWLNGLFRVYSDSHLHMIYRMDQPGWMNIFMLTRADDPKTSDVGLHMCTATPWPAAEEWHKAVIPFSTFMRKVDGKFTQLPPKNDQLCFGLLWSWVKGQRNMTIDRVWITRGGPGTIVVEPLNESPAAE